MVVMNMFEGNNGWNASYKRDLELFGIKTTSVIKLHKDMFFNFIIHITIIYLGIPIQCWFLPVLPNSSLFKKPLLLVLTLKILDFWVSSWGVGLSLVFQNFKTYSFIFGTFFPNSKLLGHDLKIGFNSNFIALFIPQD